MRYADWTDQEWDELLSLCRQDGVPLNEGEVRQAAFDYMRLGADGGGNRHGITGTVVAMNVDRVAAAKSWHDSPFGGVEVGYDRP